MVTVVVAIVGAVLYVFVSERRRTPVVSGADELMKTTIAAIEASADFAVAIAEAPVDGMGRRADLVWGFLAVMQEQGKIARDEIGSYYRVQMMRLGTSYPMSPLTFLCQWDLYRDEAVPMESYLRHHIMPNPEVLGGTPDDVFGFLMRAVLMETIEQDDVAALFLILAPLVDGVARSDVDAMDLLAQTAARAQAWVEDYSDDGVERRLRDEFMATFGEEEGAAETLSAVMSACREWLAGDEVRFLERRFGDLVLAGASFMSGYHSVLAEGLSDSLPRKRAEGVRDEDFRWWWNLPPLERAFILVTDRANFFQTYHEVATSDPKRDPWQASVAVWPVYTSSLLQNRNPGVGDDAPLPSELKARVNKRRDEWVANGGSQEELAQFSSFNAWVRSEIRLGQL